MPAIEKRSAPRVLSRIASEPWAITEPALRQIIEIAERESDIEAVETRIGKPLMNTRAVTIRNGVAIIPITGPIFRYANLFTRISGATSIDELATDFGAAIDNPEVRAILFRIDSPGGTANGPGEFAKTVKELSARAGKPVYAHIEMAASAAFWIAAAAVRRSGYETAYAGCLGAVIDVTIPPPARDGGPREITFVSSVSPKKRIDFDTDEGLAQMQRRVDDLGSKFVDLVAELMSIPRETVLSDFGQGDVLIAQDALAVGMIERIATFEEVLADIVASVQSGHYPQRGGIAAKLNTRENVLKKPKPATKADQPCDAFSPSSDDPEVCSTCGWPKGSHGDESGLRAQLAAAQREIAQFRASALIETRQRIVAEVDTFKSGLLTSRDLRFNVQTVGLFASLLYVGKCAAAGMDVLTFKAAKEGESDRELRLDAGSIGAFLVEQVGALSKATARFEVPTDPLSPAAPLPPSRTGASVTASDFAAMAWDAEASRRVAAAVEERRATNSKFTIEDLRKEVMTTAA
jgi:ClpP class serine protease